MSQKLALLSDSSDSEVDFKVNKSYADNYNNWRNKEELQKLKDLTKDISDSSSSSEEEVPEIEEDFLKTLSLLKSKDPKIYEKDVTFFKEQQLGKKTKIHKPKPLFMKDYERKLVLERNGQFSDDEECIPSEGPTYSQEQDEIKKSFKAALEDSDDDDGDGFLQAREKTKDEKDTEEADYLLWLKGQKEKVADDTEKDMSFLHKYWNDPKLDEGEKFLKDFILNKKFIVNDKDGEIPTYNEITGDVEMLMEDEKILEQQEMFEHKYNFRFEEPDDEFIKRYPRTIGDSLRRADSRRKAKREEYAERKKKEKELKREELKRLKALKRKEIEGMFMKLKEVSGQDEINLNEDDIESDFDSDKHDQKMKELFNDQYYNVEEEQKPEFPYDEELDSENWNTWSRANAELNDVEEHDASSENEEEIEENYNTNATKNSSKEEFANEMIECTQSKRKKRKKSLFAKVLSEPKPVYDPDGKSFEEYLEDYYKLDYEDVIGDMPVRYKYRKVVPNTFGLTVDEILAADDKELNRWCSVKKTCQYRDEDEELYDLKAFQRKSENEFAKKKIFQSLYSEPENKDSSSVTDAKKSRKSKKKRKKLENEQLVANQSKGNEMEVQSTSINNLEQDANPGEDVSENVHSNSENQNSTANEKEDNHPKSNEPKKKRRKKKKKTNGNENLILNQNLSQEIASEEHSNSVINNSLEESSFSQVKKRKRIDDDGTEALNSNYWYVEQESNSFKRNSNKQRKTSISDVPSDVDSKNKDFSSENNINQESERTITTEGLHIPAQNTENNPLRDNTSTSKEDDHHNQESTSMCNKKKKRKKKKKTDVLSSQHKRNIYPDKKHNILEKPAADKRLSMSDARLAAYGINPKKFKNHIMYSKN